MNKIITALFLFTAIAGFTQDYSYVLTLKGEKLEGKVQIVTYQGAGQSIALKQGKEKSTYHPYQIKEVSIKGDIYRPLKIRNKYQMGLLVSEGYLSYYKFSGDDNAPTLSFSTPLLVKSDGQLQEVSNLGFRKRLIDYLGDCESLVGKLKSKEYGRSDLDKVIDEYNAYIEANTGVLNEKTAKFKENHSKSDQIEEIKAEVSKLDIADKAEILEMLTDVQSKLKEGKTIPGYLIGALEEKLSNHKEILAKLNEAIQ